MHTVVRRTRHLSFFSGGQRHRLVEGAGPRVHRQLQPRPVPVVAVLWQLDRLHAAIPGHQVDDLGPRPRPLRRSHARVVMSTTQHTVIAHAKKFSSLIHLYRLTVF